MNSLNKHHWHYEVIGYKKHLKGGNQYNEPTSFLTESTGITILFAESSDDALEIAKGLIKKKHYVVSKIWECDVTHGLQEEMQMLQLEMQKKSLSQQGGHNHE